MLLPEICDERRRIRMEGFRSTDSCLCRLLLRTDRQKPVLPELHSALALFNWSC